MNSTKAPSPKICSFESRRRDEMFKLIQRHGGVATVAPSMREIPIEENADAFGFADELFAGRIGVMVFLTGVGARGLLEVLQKTRSREEIVAALANGTVVVRGPKPLAVMREWGIRVDGRAPEPNTWHELFEMMSKSNWIEGQTIGVQEYGEPSTELYEALTEAGAKVIPVPVYKWGFPEDPGPLFAAVERTITGDFDVLMFTSANQVTNVLTAADQLDKKEDWKAAAKKCRIASIGPTASEKLRQEGLPVHVEASPPKMGPLVKAALADFRGNR